MSRNTDKIAEYLATAGEPKTSRQLADFIGHGMREKIHGCTMVEQDRPGGPRWGIVESPHGDIARGWTGVKYGPIHNNRDRNKIVRGGCYPYGLLTFAPHDVKRDGPTPRTPNGAGPARTPRPKPDAADPMTMAQGARMIELLEQLVEALAN